ncbi:MAG TPA: head GIN domain-containing protein [Flavobacterium sp.]
MKQILLLILLVTSSLYVKSQNAITRDVGTFSGIDSRSNFDVVLVKGEKESVFIEEIKNLNPSEILTEVKNDKLILYIKGNKRQNAYAKIYITYKNLDGIYNSGSGNILCNDDLSGKKLSINTSGSGKLISKGAFKFETIAIDITGSEEVNLADIYTDNLQIAITGSGGAKIVSGKSNNQDLKITGSGNMHLFGVDNEEASIEITGSGSVDLVANKTLIVDSSGSGNVNYKGIAQIKNVKNSGSTKVMKVE